MGSLRPIAHSSSRMMKLLALLLSWERPLPRLIRRPGAAIMAMEATEALVTEAMAAMATTVERGRLKPLLWLTLSLRLMPMLGDTATATAMAVPTTVATTALGIMARGLLTLSLKLMPKPAPTTTAATTAMLVPTSGATTALGIMAKGLLTLS